MPNPTIVRMTEHYSYERNSSALARFKKSELGKRIYQLVNAVEDSITGSSEPPSLKLAIKRHLFNTDREGRSNQPLWSYCLSLKSDAIVLSPYWRSKTEAELFSYYDGEESIDYRCKVHQIQDSDYAVVKPYDVAEYSWRVSNPSPALLSDVYRILDEEDNYINDPSVIPRLLLELVGKANNAVYTVVNDIAESRVTIKWLMDIVPRAKRSVIKLGRYNYAVTRENMFKFKQWLAKQRKNHVDVMARGLRSIPKRFRSAARYWLEYRYAVRPIMYSIRDALQASVLRHKRFQKFYASTTDTQTKDGEFSGLGWKLSRKVTYRAHIRQRVDLSKIENRYNLFVPLGLWEIVPYSFVIDWFVNIGDLLSAFRGFYGDLRLMQSSVRVDTQVELFVKSYDKVEQEPTSVDRSDPITIRKAANGHLRKIRKFRPDQAVAVCKRVSYNRVMSGPLKISDYQIHLQRRALSLKRQVDAAALLFLSFKGIPNYVKY